MEVTENDEVDRLTKEVVVEGLATVGALLVDLSSTGKYEGVYSKRMGSCGALGSDVCIVEFSSVELNVKFATRASGNVPSLLLKLRVTLEDGHDMDADTEANMSEELLMIICDSNEDLSKESFDDMLTASDIE
jgi:hypothetical protein